MARVRRIVVSQIEGNYSNSSDKRPKGEITLYDDNDNGFDLVIHDGENSTNENKVLGKGKLYGHNGSSKIIAGPTSSVEWNFNLNGDLVLPEGGDIKDHLGSSVLSGGLSEVTYSELVNMIDEGELTAGKFYKITDFNTCYDQPDYDYNSDPITDGNYKQGTVSPIIVFAISSDSLSSDAYQPEYPNDNIKYDASFSQTEVTGGTAYGRIVYRKDNQGNAFDYDFREVFFKRYDAYFSEEVYDGTISIAASGSFGVVTGVDTFFDNFATGSVVGVLNTNTEYIVDYYEIISIENDTNMVVTGNVINTINNTRLLDANLLTKVSWKQNNILSNTASSEFRTFGNIDRCFSNTSTNTVAYTSWEEYTFLLPNNVFKGNNNDYRDNLFGHDFRNNTFNATCDSNRIGGSFYNNIIDNDFDNNIINDNFYNNIMDCDFQRNLINGEFYNNHLGDNDGNDFDYNIIQGSFYNNFYTGDNDFEYNLIKENFYNNIILGQFSKNTLNGFYQNTTEATFSDNQVGESFYGNKTYQEFRENVIGDEVYDNNFFGTFIGNVLIGDEIYENSIYSDFGDNQIGGNFQNNNIGDSGNINNTYFKNNKIGNNFSNNTIRRDFEDNQIGNNFQENNVYGDFYGNHIGNGFNNNGYIGHDFYENHIGNGFNSNSYIGDYFYGNKIGEDFEDNYITNNFRENSIGNSFDNNTLGDTQYFTWDNTTIENLTERNYTTFYNSLYGDDGNVIGNVILGKELIMHFTRNSGTTMSSGNLIIGESYEITNYQGTDDFTDVADIQSGVINTNGCVFIATGPTVSNWSSGSELTELTSYDEYHKVKFTQWTQNNNGGGFSYERTEVYPNSGSTVYFTKLNYGSEVDVIIPGRLEIRRDNNGAIYNYVEEGEWDENISPEGTEWNSIYTHQNQGGFDSNEIQNLFKGNFILGEFFSNKIGFGFLSNNLYGYFVNNKIDNNFDNNDINSFDSNRVGNDFQDNTIGENFYNNEIGIDFNSNNISSEFSNNKIGAYFESNNIEEGFGVGYGNSQKNIIDDYFQNNNIGEYFYNNKVASYFQNNNVGYYFQRNNIDIPIFEEDFIVNYGNILAFTYQSSGTTSTPGFYNISGTTSGHGESASFGITVSGGTISTISLVSAGNQYAVGNTISIPGTQIGGVSRVIGTFSISSLSVKIYTPTDSTYQFPDNETEMDYLIDNSPLFDTYYSSNIQGVSYTTKTGVNQTQYAMVIEGYIKIPSSGTYSFGLSSDDSSDAFINGIRVADWYGAHGESGNVPGGTQSPISLTAGTYPIKVRLQQRNGQDIVILLYSLDGVSWNIIPDNWFTPDITGITGSYPGIFATGGTGEGSTFDVEVIGGLVDSVVLSNGGGSYSVGDVLTISGSEFGGTQSIIINVDSLYSDDVTITVTEVGATPSVYGDYNTNIFRNGGGNLRLSYFDGDDVLTIKNINE